MVFYLPKFQGIVRLSFWKSWTFLNFRAISVYTDMHFVCLWYTWGQKCPVTKFGQLNPWFMIKDRSIVSLIYTHAHIYTHHDILAILFIIRLHPCNLIHNLGSLELINQAKQSQVTLAYGFIQDYKDQILRYTAFGCCESECLKYAFLLWLNGLHTWYQITNRL